MTFHIPNAVELITAAKPILTRGRWGDGKAAVCMMSALQPGAKSDDDCVTAGWPEWLSILNHELFDAKVGGDEDAAAFQFALSVAEAIQVPRDYDKARDLFLIRRLDTGDCSALKTLRGLDGDWPVQIAAVEAMVALLHRRVAGEDIQAEMAMAKSYAYAASHASNAASHASNAASYASNAASYVASYVAKATSYAAKAAYCAAKAAAAANAAANAAHPATNADRPIAYAAYAAARDDLIAALVAS